MLYDWDVQGDTVLFGGSVKKILGYDQKEINGSSRKLLEIIHVDDQSIFKSFYNNLDRADREVSQQLRILTKDGQYIHVDDRSYLSCDSKGKCIHKIGILTDISEQHAQTELAQKAYDNLKTILNKSPFGVVLIGRDRKIRWANETACALAGVADQNELYEKNCGEYLCSTLQDECPILDLNQNLDHSERLLCRKDGREIPILKTVSVVEMDGQELLLETFVDNHRPKESRRSCRKRTSQTFRYDFRNERGCRLCRCG